MRIGDRRTGARDGESGDRVSRDARHGHPKHPHDVTVGQRFRAFYDGRDTLNVAFVTFGAASCANAGEASLAPTYFQLAWVSQSS
jgi:hypothetical protein